DFGSVTVGTSKTQVGTLSASGSSVSVSAATVTSAEFSLSGITFPLTIAAGQSVPFTLMFTPQTSGSASAIGSFTSNASNPAAETEKRWGGVAVGLGRGERVPVAGAERMGRMEGADAEARSRTEEARAEADVTRSQGDVRMREREREGGVELDGKGRRQGADIG